MLEVLWDPDAGAAFERLPGAEDAAARSRSTRGSSSSSTRFLALHEVEVDGAAARGSTALRAEHDEAAARDPPLARDRGRADRRGRRACSAASSQPFQWAGVRYALEARRAFLADEQGLGKTVEALAALEADGAFPAVVVCPASLKLNWQREAARWLPHRTVAVVDGRARGPAARRHHDPQLRDRRRAPRGARAPPPARARRRRVALLQEPARQAHAGGAPARGERSPADGLRLALTGTPVLNHAEELIAQLRVIGRLEDFGSGARFARQFHGRAERGAPALAPAPALLRAAAEARRAAPAAGQAPGRRADRARQRARVPPRRGRRDRLAARRSRSTSPSSNAKIAATLRAERLAQLGTLQRLAARGKLHAALAWIHDFLASGEPLVVFARHVEVQQAVLERFPDALHLLGADAPPRARRRSPLPGPRGPQLIVCATRVGGAGHHADARLERRLPRARVDAAMHDQAEDRCHRIGQRDAVTAWYLLAAETIDETMARLIQRKRAPSPPSPTGTPSRPTGWSTRSSPSCAEASRSSICARWRPGPRATVKGSAA